MKVIRIEMESSSGYCPECYAYEDRLIMTDNSISYECIPLSPKGFELAAKWQYSTDCEMYKKLFAQVAEMSLDSIQNIPDQGIVCDASMVDIKVIYSDWSREERPFVQINDVLADLKLLIRSLIPGVERIPEVLHVCADYEDEIDLTE